MKWGSSNAKAYKKIHLKTFLNKWVMSTSGLRAYRFGRNKLTLKRSAADSERQMLKNIKVIKL